jgi:hypothetical protein
MPARDLPKRWTIAGVSAAGIITQQDFGHTEQDIELNFRLKNETLKNQIKDYLLNVVKPYGSVVIVPTVGDQLETGATTATNFTFVSFEATYVAGVYWDMKIVVRKYN